MLGRESEPDISCEWNPKISTIAEIPSKRVHSKRIPKFSKTFPGIFTVPFNKIADRRSRNFWSNGKRPWYGNFRRKIPENPDLLNFRKGNHSTESCGNSGVKIKWNGYFQEITFENLSIPHEVGLFFGNSANSRFAIQCLWLLPRSQRVGHLTQGRVSVNGNT